MPSFKISAINLTDIDMHWDDSPKKALFKYKKIG